MLLCHYCCCYVVIIIIVVAAAAAGGSGGGAAVLLLLLLKMIMPCRQLLSDGCSGVVYFLSIYSHENVTSQHTKYHLQYK